jgi:hypothetical protein
VNSSHYLPNLVSYVLATRLYGNCYVHANVRKSMFGFEGIIAEVGGRPCRLTWTGWGRSLQSNGHKYKAHARYCDDGKPVPTILLRTITPILEVA